jgi:hypothetical protein
MHIAMSTRPDIASAVSTRALYQSLDAGVTTEALQVLRYLRHCIAWHHIWALAWVADLLRQRLWWAAQTRRSTTGACVVMHGGVVVTHAASRPSQCPAARLNTSSLRLLCAWRCGRLPPELV